MLKSFEPNKIFLITSRAPKYVLFLFIIVLSIGLTEALILSPEDYNECQIFVSDLNEDGSINIQDIILLVNIILS